MHRAPLADHQHDLVAAGLPFVESLARRMASTMPHSIDLGDLVQDGVVVPRRKALDNARCRCGISRGTAEIPPAAVRLAGISLQGPSLRSRVVFPVWFRTVTARGLPQETNRGTRNECSPTPAPSDR